jgi:hypothetical protein
MFFPFENHDCNKPDGHNGISCISVFSDYEISRLICSFTSEVFVVNCAKSKSLRVIGEPGENLSNENSCHMFTLSPVRKS